MRIIWPAILVGICSALLMSTGKGTAGNVELSGKMSSWQHLVGHWTCSMLIEGRGEQQPQEGLLSAVGEVVPGNVFHWHVAAAGYAGDQYDGYSESAKRWWEAESDSGGFATLLQSNDGVVFEQISDISIAESTPQPARRVVYSISDSGVFHEVNMQRGSDGSWYPETLVKCTSRQTR